MKLGLFTDSHYSSVSYLTRETEKSLERIEKALRHFTQEKCDLVICLGDLIDHEKTHEEEKANLFKIADVFKKFDIPKRVVMGNHDAFSFEVDEFYEILGQECRPENIYGEKNLIFLDACYFKSGVHYMPGDDDWTDTFYPKTDELIEMLKNIQTDAYIFMHQNIDPDIEDDLRLYNDKEIRKILEDSKKVKAVFQGHEHLGGKSFYNGIDYTTFKALCEFEDAYYIIEI